MASDGLVLRVVAEPDRAPPGDLLDLRLGVTFENQSSTSIDLYPGVARFSVEAGWGSPSWHLEATGGQVKLFQLRHWYGSPGMPPSMEYFEPHRRRLAVGQRDRHDLLACFIPADRLRDQHLSREALDPEGMDGWSPPPAGSSVLVLGRSRADLAAEMASRVDFLRPSVLALLQPGDLHLRLRYQQHRWNGFDPGSPVDVEGDCAFTVG